MYCRPIVWLRYFSMLFYQVLDLALLNLFLLAMDCQYFAVDAALVGTNLEFPGVQCWAMPHMIHVGVSAVAILMFWLMASLYIMADVDLSPASTNWMGVSNTKVELIAFCIKMIMACFTIFIPDVKWQSVFQLLASFYLVYIFLKWLPHRYAFVNHIRVGSFCSVFFAAMLYCIMSFHPGLGVHDDKARRDQQQVITYVLWAGFVPMGLLGGYLSFRRTQFLEKVVVGKFR